MNKSRKLPRGLAAVGSVGAAALLISTVAAAADETTIEEIIVTATKRAERLQDVPVAISAIGAEDIRARGFTQFADFLNSVPGVYFQDGGPGTSVVHIRGASEAGGGAIVATYFGETLTSVLTNHGGKPNLRLVDIDRVEVLRGPQGTVFGTDALAGVIRTIPASPDLQNFTADVGTRGFATKHSEDLSYHVEGVVNLPLIENKLALRVVGYKDEIAGYIDNVVPDQPAVDYSAIGSLLFGVDLPAGTLVTPAIAGFTHRDINSEDTWGARAALTWQATDRLKFDLTYAHQDVTLNSEPYTTPAVGPYEVSRSLDVYQQGGYGEKLDISSLVIAYDWDAVSLTSATSYMEMDRFARQDITFLAENAFGAPIPWSLNDTSLGKLFTQEVRLQSRGEDALQWTVGAFYMDEKSDLAQIVPDFSCPTCLPALLGQEFALNAPNQKFYEKEQRALFGEASYSFTPKWTVGLGARYLEDDIESGSPSAEGLLAGGTLEGSSNSASADEFNPSGYLRFKATDDMTLYLQAGRGFRSGTVNQVLPDACSTEAAQVGLKAITDPDTMWNYELGFKSQLAGGRVGLNAAVYQEEWKGVQLGIGLECGFSGAVNGGDAEGKGVEIEATIQATDAWRFNFSYSHNQMEFTSVQPGTGFVEGQRLPDAPKENGSAGVQYDFAMGETWAGFARADYTYVGDVEASVAGGTVVLDPYDVVNVRLGFSHDQLALELFGRNVFDERGVLVNSGPAQGNRENLIRPLEYGVELRYSFR